MLPLPLVLPLCDAPVQAGSGVTPPGDPLDQLIATLEAEGPIVALYDGARSAVADATTLAWADARGAVGVPDITYSGANPPTVGDGWVMLTGEGDCHARTVQSALFGTASANRWVALIGGARVRTAYSGWFFMFEDAGATGTALVALYTNNANSSNPNLLGLDFPYNSGGFEQTDIVSQLYTPRLSLTNLSVGGDQRIAVGDLLDAVVGSGPGAPVATSAIVLGELNGESIEGRYGTIVAGEGLWPTANQLAALRTYAIQQKGAVFGYGDTALNYFAQDGVTPDDAFFRSQIRSTIGTFDNPALAGTSASADCLYNDGNYADLLSLDASVTIDGQPTFRMTLPPSTAAAPYFQRGFAAAWPEAWLRRSVVYQPGFTCEGIGSGGAAAYKRGPNMGFAGFDGRIGSEYTNSSQYVLESGPNADGAASSPQSASDGNVTTEWTEAPVCRDVLHAHRLDADSLLFEHYFGRGPVLPSLLLDYTTVMNTPGTAPEMIRANPFGENYNRTRTSEQALQTNVGTWQIEFTSNPGWTT